MLLNAMQLSFVCQLFFLALIFPPSLGLAPLEVGWAAYKKLLVEKPLLTKSTTSAIIMGVSDAMTQRLEHRFLGIEKKFDHDWRRTWYAFSTGFCWSGPSAHTWYQQLENICGYFPVSGPIQGLVLRLVLDALIFSPITIAGFFTANSLIQGKSLAVIQEKLSTKWKNAVYAAWSFWPVVNIVNFSMIPLSFRVLYSNIMALIWTGYLSYVNNQKMSKLRTA